MKNKVIKLAGSIPLFQIFLFLFLFTTFNRTFRIFTFDPRYIGFGLAVILIFRKIVVYKERKRPGDAEKYLFLFYFFMLLSNISWISNDFQYQDMRVVYNLAILNLYNFLSFVVFWLYKDELKEDEISAFVIIASIVLMISIFWVYFGQKMPELFVEANARVKTVGEVGGEHHNVFGQTLRVAGFAEDANYATLFSVLAIFTACKFLKNRLFKVIFILLELVAMGLSFSRTIFLGVAAAFIWIGIGNRVRGKIREIDSFFVVGVMVSCFLAPFIDWGEIMGTVSTRFKLWGRAFELFTRHPVIGSGLGSFRYYNGSFYDYDWIVHSHNAYWQVVSEHGILGVICFFQTIRHKFLEAATNFQRMVLIIFVIFSGTYESVYLQLFVLSVCLLQTANKKEQQNESAFFCKFIGQWRSGESLHKSGKCLH